MTSKQPTHLVVDGSNIATEGRSAPSLEQLDEAVRAILEEYPHDRLTVVVDATFGHRIAESERPAYEEAILAGEIVAPPAGAIGRGDAFILQVADKANATVFSNDSFQEFHGEHEWLFDEGRLVGGKPVPGVGWVFVNRVPVRGPASRRSVRESKRSKTTGGRGARVDTAKAIERETKERRARKRPPSAERATVDADDAPKPARSERDTSSDGNRRAPAGTSPAPAPATEALNEPPVFLAFITKHRIGSELEATVDHFSSHGAYVVADGARCYLPTKTMGDPPPNRARDIIDRHDVVRVEVQSLDAERRGINVRFVDVVRGREGVEGPAPERPEDHDVPPSLDLDGAEPVNQPGGKSDVATKRTAKKAAAKKAPSGRAPAKKSAAKKAAAEASLSPRVAKATAKKAPTKKATAKKATAEKATATKATATKAPAKKATAKKAAAKKATAKNATATEANEAPATKATTRKASAKKATTNAAAAKKAPAKKATTKKAAAKATAKKAATKRTARASS